jgi:hypothetical protein
MTKLTPRAKKMAIVIFVLLFTFLPYRWGSQHSTSLTDAIESSKSEIQSIESKLASVDAQGKVAPLQTQVDTLRIFVPNDASLPTFIPIVANAGASVGMFLSSGSPLKAVLDTSGTLSGLKDIPSDTKLYTMNVSFTGPAANLPRLLDALDNMNRTISVDSFSTQSSSVSGQLIVNISLKFYSVQVG